MGRVLHSQAEPRTEVFVNRYAGSGRVDRHRSTSNLLRVHIAKDDIGVSDCRCSASAPVAGRSGHSTGAPWPHAQRATLVHPGEAASAGADFDDIVGRHAQGVACAFTEPAGDIKARAHFAFSGLHRLAVFDQTRLHRSATHIKGHGL